MPSLSDSVLADRPAAAQPAAPTGSQPNAADPTGRQQRPEPVPMRPVRPVPHEFGPAGVADRAWQRASVVPPGVLVVVSSADGGVGRSTLVAALGGVLALAVAGPVAAVDMVPAPWGGLADRIGRHNPGSVWDAVRDLQTLTSLREFQRWAQQGPSGLLALVGETEVRGRRPPRHHEAAAVVEAVRRLTVLTVCDLPPALQVGHAKVIAASAAPIVMARATVDSLRHALQLLTQLRATRYGAVADRCLLVIMATSPRTARDVRAVVQQASAVATVVEIPFDPGLAVPEPIDPRRLHRPTRHALVRLAEQVLLRCAAVEWQAIALGQPR
jgi:MinD-like ATPase involved in chromosome partitioning or flagellar assembly